MGVVRLGGAIVDNSNLLADTFGGDLHNQWEFGMARSAIGGDRLAKFGLGSEKSPLIHVHEKQYDAEDHLIKEEEQKPTKVTAQTHENKQ